jgi:hypothetical protein
MTGIGCGGAPVEGKGKRKNEVKRQKFCFLPLAF